jgi:hypothetical protein
MSPHRAPDRAGSAIRFRGIAHVGHQPPPVRDHKLELYELERLARTFDAFGDEIGGARYPAVAFVQWLADEYAATGRRPRRGDEGA